MFHVPEMKKLLISASFKMEATVVIMKTLLLLARVLEILHCMEIIDLLIHKTLRTPQDLGLESGVELKYLTLITKHGNKFVTMTLILRTQKHFADHLNFH